MKTPSSVDAVDHALAELEALDRPALVARWEAEFRRPAPFKCRANLLRSGLAWHLQMRAWQGQVPSKASLVRLLRAAQDKRASLTQGTSLVREWNGKTHRVSVLTKGFEYEGTRYASLTAVTRRITGTAWSGPLFFGLRK